MVVRATTAIAGATSTTYSPVALDVGKVLSLKVTFKAAGWTVPSGPGGRRPRSRPPPSQRRPFIAPTPLVTGVSEVGSTLTADPGTWQPTPATFAFQWFRKGAAAPVAIAGDLSRRIC